MFRFGCSLILCFLCSCATLFSSRENKRQYLNVSEQIELTDQHGEAVPIYRQFDRYFIIPGDRVRELSFSKNGQKYFVELHRKPSLLLFLDACAGYPMVIDDASDSWYYYPDIDLNAAKSAVPTFEDNSWPRPFVGAGIGLSVHAAPQKYDIYHFEATLGARMAQSYSLFLRYEAAGAFAVAYDSSFRSGAESLLSLGLRWYPVVDFISQPERPICMGSSIPPSIINPHILQLKHRLQPSWQESAGVEILVILK